jgi:cell division protein FtsN
MSTNAVGVTGKVQLPIVIGNQLSPVGSSTSRALAVISSDAERPQTISDPCMSAAPQNAAPAAFAGAFFGCLVTLHLSAFGIVPEIASALVTTLLGGQLLIARSTILSAREFVPAVYGGAFGGMTSVLWLSGMGSEHPDLWVVGLFISLSVVCGLAFSAVAIFDAYAGRRWTHGYGGRSGAIATVACVLFIQLAALAGANDGLFHAAGADLANVNFASLAPLIAACLTGTVVTLLVLRRARVAAADLADRTFVASAVALIGLLVVHRMSPTDARLLEAYYAGCFLGMSSRERLNGWIETILGAIVLAGLIIQVRIFLPGIGGGLGLAAFVTVAILVTLKQFMRFVLPINRSENMATQLPIVPSRFEHRVPTPPSERRRKAWSGISLRPATVIASLAVAAALIGGLIWPTHFASKKTIAVATTSVSAGEVATPDPAASRAEERSSAIDGPPPSASAAEPSSGSMPSSENTPRENKSSDIPTDISAASTAGLRLSGAAVAEQAATSEESKTAEFVTSQPNTSEPKASEPKIAESKVAEPTTAEPKTVPPVTSDVIAARGPALGEPQKDDDSFARDALFREYLRWRAARVPAVTPSTRQTAAKNHHHVRPLAGVATPAANPQPRSEHPLSSAETPSVTSPMPHPRRSHPGNAQTHAAIEPATPAPAASSPSF